MYSYTLRLAAASSSSIAGLGRVGGRTRAGSVVPACGRSVSSTPAGNAPVPGVQGVGMEQPQQQQQPQVPPQDAAGDKNKRDDMHKTIRWDVMTHSFGEAYATRCDEEGFGGVYGQNDPVENPGTEIHPSHPRDDMHKTIRWDVMTHSFGEGYATRCDDEGFGGVYGQNDPVENPGTETHPSHPEYDTSQGSEVKEKEKARHLKDDKHATA